MNIITLNPQDLVSEEMTTTSLKVAEVFSKQHKNVLQSIERVDCSIEFNRLNFQPVTYFDAKNEERNAVEITKDGFMFLVMGFTGKKAAEIKEKYIAAFNWMEQQLKNGAMCVPVTPQHKADHMVSAGRTFKSLVGAARTMGMSRPRAIRAASAATERATGVNLVDELGADDLLQSPDRLLGYDGELVARIRDWCVERESFTLDELVLGIGSPDADRRKIGMILHELGWQSNKIRQGNRFGRRYSRVA